MCLQVELPISLPKAMFFFICKLKFITSIIFLTLIPNQIILFVFKT